MTSLFVTNFWTNLSRDFYCRNDVTSFDDAQKDAIRRRHGRVGVRARTPRRQRPQRQRRRPRRKKTERTKTRRKEEAQMRRGRWTRKWEANLASKIDFASRLDAPETIADVLATPLRLEKRRDVVRQTGRDADGSRRDELLHRGGSERTPEWAPGDFRCLCCLPKRPRVESERDGVEEIRGHGRELFVYVSSRTPRGEKKATEEVSRERDDGWTLRVVLSRHGVFGKIPKRISVRRERISH